MVNICLTENVTRPIKFTLFNNNLAEKVQSISNRHGGFKFVLQHLRKKFLDQKHRLFVIICFFFNLSNIKVYKEAVTLDFISFCIFKYF